MPPILDRSRERRAQRGVETERWRGDRSRWRWCRTPTSVRTHRELRERDRTYTPRSEFENARAYEPACSGVVLYLGLKKAYDHLLHHDFVFSRDPHEEFDFIYRKGEPAA